MGRAAWAVVASFLLVLHGAGIAFAQQILNGPVVVAHPGGSGSFVFHDPAGCESLVSVESEDESVATVDLGAPILTDHLVVNVTGLKSGSTTLVVRYASTDPGCEKTGTLTLSVIVLDPTTVVSERSAATVADPIAAADGTFYEHTIDLVVPGVMTFGFERSYSSRLWTHLTVQSALGRNWCHNFDVRIQRFPSVATVQFLHGQPVRFVREGTGPWTLDSREPLGFQLTETSSVLRLLDPSSGLTYEFDAVLPTGRLLRIVDRGGNALTLTHTPIPHKLTRVADAFGRRLDFTYTGSNLTRVEDQAGRRVEFSYSGSVLASATGPDGGVTQYRYATGSSPALLESVVRPRGNVPFVNAYDIEGRVIGQTDGAGGVVTLQFDAPRAGTTTVTGPAGAKTLFLHDDGDFAGLEDGPGPGIVAESDDRHRRTSVMDRGGGETTWTYHPETGLKQETLWPGGTSMKLTFAASGASVPSFHDVTRVDHRDRTFEIFEIGSLGQVTERTGRAGESWKFTYDSRNRATSVTMPNTGVFGFAYGPNGLLSSITPPGGGPAAFAYDAAGRVASVTRPSGSLRGYEYDIDGRLTRVVREDGTQVRATHDANGNLATFIDPLGGVTSFSYDAMDRCTTMTPAFGGPVAFEFGAAGRLSAFVDPGGARTELAYDPRGFRMSVTDPGGGVWQELRDADGRLGGIVTPLGERTLFGRDADGDVTRLTFPTGAAIDVAYDAMSRPVWVRDPLFAPTSVAYDANGLQTRRELPGGASVSYGRDPTGRVVAATGPSGDTWEFERNLAGKLVGWTDPLGQETKLDLDVLGRVSRFTYPGGRYEAITRSATGQLTGLTGSDGTSAGFSYDAAGNLVGGTGLVLGRDALGAIVGSNGVAVTRGPNGLIEGIALVPGKTIGYEYDVNGRVVRVSDWMGGTTRLAYDAAGRRTSLTRTSGIVSTWQYDGLGLPMRIEDRSSEGILAGHTYTRDAAGRVIGETVQGAPAAGFADIAGADLDVLAGPGSRVEGFGYDVLGNRTSGNGLFTFDLLSRMSRAEAGPVVIDLGYDVLGRPVRWTSGATTRTFTWNYALRVPSVAMVGDGTAPLWYVVPLPSGELLYAVDAVTGLRIHFHFDGSGNTAALSNDAGVVTDAYTYSPWGRIAARTGTTENPFTFRGEWSSPQLGMLDLHHLGSRWYDPLSGRYLSPAPPASTIGLRTADPYALDDDDPVSGGGPPEEKKKGAIDTLDDVVGKLTDAEGAIGALGELIPSLEKFLKVASGEQLEALQEFLAYAKEHPDLRLMDTDPGMLLRLRIDATRLKWLGKSLDAIGTLGTGTDVVGVVNLGVDLDIRMDEVATSYRTERDRLLADTVLKEAEADQLLKDKKLTPSEWRSLRLAINHEYQLRTFWIDENFTTDVIFESTLALKDGFAAFLPFYDWWAPKWLSSENGYFNHKPKED